VTERRYHEASDESEFETTVAIERGENQVTVAAASDADLETAGTTVRRLKL
jgi:hypothetical protein